MKISDFETHVEYELETPEGHAAFVQGVKSGDRGQWRRSPETAELLDQVNANTRHNRIFVKVGNLNTRVK